MDITMLKYLVELAGGEVNPINTKAFFERYPRKMSTRELIKFKKMGFVSLLSGDNEITEIAVNQKAIDYLKNKPV